MKKNRFLSVIILIFFLCNVIFSLDNSSQKNKEKEKKDNKSISKKKKPMFKMILEDERDIWTSPFRMKGKDVFKWVGTAIITGLLIKNDEAIYRDFKEFQKRNKWIDQLSPKITVLGDGNVNLGIVGLFYLGGVIFKDKKAKETAKLSLMSLIHSAIVVQLLKHLTGRQRPEVSEGKDHWEGPSGFFKRYKNHQDALFDAFPSGHTITIWSIATVVAEMYKENVFVPILCYSIATLTGLSRITEDKHWLSDVFFGAVLGYAISKFIVKKRKSKFHIAPVIGNNKTGISINYIF